MLLKINTRILARTLVRITAEIFVRILVRVSTGILDPVGWGWILDKRERTPQDSVKFLNSGLIPDPTGSHNIPDKILQNGYYF